MKYDNYPYVYKGTNKETGEFYIGYREANKLPSKLDLGFRYIKLLQLKLKIEYLIILIGSF